MFSHLYFAAASALSARNASPKYAQHVLAGQFNEASKAAAVWTDHDHGEQAADPAAMQAYGDIQLLLGRPVEAEETLRRAQRLIRHPRDTMHVVSCRNAGWQAFFQYRYSTALTCFKRVTDDAMATMDQRLESLVGVVLVLHHLGCLNTIGTHLDTLVDLAARAPEPRWAQLADALHRDLLIQHQLRRADELHDHIYWRSVAPDFVHADHGQPDVIKNVSSNALPVLAQRLTYLHNLMAFANGTREAQTELDVHLQWAAQANLEVYQRGLYLEVAVAAIAAKKPHAAETALNQSRVANAHGVQHERWYLDYLYCLAKVRQSQGRVQEFAQLYGRYALASIQHVRADKVPMPAAVAEIIHSVRNQPRSDDVSARLPGKYRRAYSYMMEHLDQHDLSVRELASHIGVTERALQAAFKTYLGLSPSHLIRRERMERIHDELTHDEGHATSVLEVANKWGVQHRSTLVNGYRKIFNEAPSKTLAR